jgi:hypothetical protein
MVVHLAHESPRYELGVHFPAQAPGTQIDSQVSRFLPGAGLMVIDQQARQMLTARLATGSIGPHHDV